MLLLPETMATPLLQGFQRDLRTWVQGRVKGGGLQATCFQGPPRWSQMTDPKLASQYWLCPPILSIPPTEGRDRADPQRRQDRMATLESRLTSGQTGGKRPKLLALCFQVFTTEVANSSFPLTLSMLSPRSFHYRLLWKLVSACSLVHRLKLLAWLP